MQINEQYPANYFSMDYNLSASKGYHLICSLDKQILRKLEL